MLTVFGAVAQLEREKTTFYKLINQYEEGK
ncbi:hypothetical protein [Clostridium algoriphilum]